MKEVIYMEKASDYRALGYNCAEAVIKKYNDDFNTDIPVCAGSGMGGGAFSGSLCGSINGAIIVIGFLKGRNDSSEKNNTVKYVHKLMTTIKEKYSTELCRELKANGVSCAEIIDYSYEVLKDVLKED